MEPKPTMNYMVLMTELMSPDNVKRSQAEKTFTTLKQVASDGVLVGLTQLLRQSEAPLPEKSLAAVLLRQVLLKDTISLWLNTSEKSHLFVKVELVRAIVEESDASLRRKICHIVGEVASAILDDGQWNELVPILFTWIQSTNSILKMSSLTILGMVADTLITLTTTEMLLELFGNCLQDDDGRVRYESLKALEMILYCMGESASMTQETFQVLVPLVLRSLERNVHLQEKELLTMSLETMISLADTVPILFANEVSSFIVFMPFLCGEVHEKSIRQLSLEFLVCFAENASKVCKHNNAFLTTIFPIAFTLMLDIESSLNWSQCSLDAENDVEEDDITNYDVGLQALDRLARVFPRACLPVIFPIVESYFKENDVEKWQYKHTALMGISQVMEILEFEPEVLDPIMHCILEHTQSAVYHPRIVYAALNCIGQCALDHGPHFQMRYHPQVIPVLIHGLTLSPQVRLQAHAAAAIVNFMEFGSVEIMKPYLPSLLQTLLSCVPATLQTGPESMVQEQAITAIAAIADCVQAHFIPYYDTFIPQLQLLLTESESVTASSSCSDEELTDFSGKVLECMTLIGSAVGKDRFRADAIQLMAWMTRASVSGSYVLQAWARLCKVLGKEFTPYLPYVMPSLLDAATQTAEIELDHYPDEEDYQEDDDDDMEIATVNDKCYSIRTSILEEKSTACSILSCMAEELEEGFFPYVEQVTKIFAPLITDSVHADIRSTTVTAIPCLVRSTSLATGSSLHSRRQAVPQLLEYALGRLVCAVTSEPEVEVVLLILQSMQMSIEAASCVQLGGIAEVDPAVLNDAQLAQVLKALHAVLGDCMQRRAVRRANLNVVAAEHDGLDDDDITQEQSEEAMDEQLLFAIAECMGTLAKTHSVRYLSVFKSSTLPTLYEMSESYCLEMDRKFAIYVLDDVLEYCPCQDLYSSIVPILQQGMLCPNPALRQAAAYGLGIAAQNGASFTPFAQSSLEAIQTALQDPHAFDEEVLIATDNAISAMGVICQNFFSTSDPLLAQWIHLLPLRKDEEEGKMVALRLSTMVLEQNTAVLGKGNAHGFKILSILLQNWCRLHILGDQVSCELLGGAVQSLVGIVAQSQLQELWSSLPAIEQERSKALLF